MPPFTAKAWIEQRRLGVWGLGSSKVGEKKPGQVAFPLWHEMFSYLIWVFSLLNISHVRISHSNQVFQSPRLSHSHPHFPSLDHRGLLRAMRTIASYSQKSPRKPEKNLFVFPIPFRPVIS